MKPRASALRAPILMASILVVAGIGYAAYASTASVTITSTAASFELVITALSDPPAPANVALTVVGLNSPSVTLTLNTLLGGQTLVIDYTVEDIGTVGAKNVGETPTETFTNCDGALALAQVGVAPTSLSPLTPASGAFSITDNAPPGAVPAGCPDPFTAVWHFDITGTAV
jgi:hypothetical protein